MDFIEDQLVEILNKPYQLTAQQKDAVISESDYLQIVAGAGSGKTETMTRKLLYYLIIKKCEPKSLVAFTFTEKAAESIKSRVHERLTEFKREDLLKKFGQMYIGTIHGFCSRILEEHDKYSNYSTFDENQEMAFILREGYNIGFKSKELDIYGGYFKKSNAFVDTLNVVYGELISRNVLKKKAEHTLKMIERYENLLEANHKLTFNLLVYKVVNEIKQNPKLIKSIKHLIVDEFQDINKAQYDLIKMIGKYASVSIVGDPRQSIYQWRGGDSSFFNKFCEDFKNVERIQISRNNRSSQKIAAVSNLISGTLNDVKFEEMTARRSDEGRVIKVIFRDETEEANAIVQKIAEIVREQKANYSDIAILYRSVKTSASELINSLKEEKIPYLVGGGIGLFKRDDTQAVGRFVVWLSKNGYWQTNAYNWKEKEEGDTLLKTGIDLWSGAVKFKVNKTDLERKLRNWKKQVTNKGVNDEYQYKDVLYDLFDILGYKNFDPKIDFDSSIMANLGRFSNIIGDFQSTFRLGGNKRNLEGELLELCKFLNNYAILSYEEKQADERISNNCVSIMTIHQAKGLEWPIVFIPAMINRRFPSNRKTNPDTKWLIPKDTFEYERYLGSDEDERRLFYVAVTRARDILVLSTFNRYKSGTSCKESVFFDIINVNGNCEVSKNLSTIKINKTEVASRMQEGSIEAFPVKELIDYVICPFHYRLSKDWGYVQRVDTFEGYGAALHASLKQAANMIKEGSSIQNAVDKSVNESFFLPYATSAINNKKKEQIKVKLGTFVKKHKTDMENVKETETRIEFPTEGATITGKVDVILNAGGLENVEVRDYKTSENVIKKELSELQVQLYSEGLKSFDWNVIKGSVSNLDENETKYVNVSSAAINGALTEAKSIIKKIKKNKFGAKPSSFCKDCEYKTICKWKLK